MLIPSVLAIAYIDYLVLNKYTRCQFCNKENTDWRTWILPTMLEITLFLGGFALGIVAIK